MNTASVALAFCIMAGSVVLVLGFAWVRRNKSRTQRQRQTPVGPNPPSGSQQLTTPASGQLGTATMVAPNAVVAPDGSLRVTYPAGSYASKGGVVKGVPIGPFTSATLSYEVLFEPGWCWGGSKQGGKLPGLWFGAMGAGCGTGGNWGTNCGSVRPMWGADGSPYAYIYYAKSGKANDDMSDQSPEYTKRAKPSGKTGHSLFKGALPTLKADNTWNKIVVSAKMNTPGKQDGELSLSVNGKKQTFQGIAWRTAADQMIREAAIHSFHGGGSAQWACSSTTNARFRNFVVTGR